MLKRIFKILAIILLIPYALVLVYAVVPPISLPIIGDALTFQEVHWRWRSYDKISPNLRRAIITAEDGRFCEHNGVDWEAVEKAVKRAQKKHKITHGASTIPMQTSKNLFLWFYPDFIRKPLEFPLAIWMDFVWSKRRMMEIYMNIAEWGDGIYGAEAAARAKFKKSAANLTSQEASLLVATLPNPIKRNAARPSKYVRSYAGNIKAKSHSAITGCMKK